jgi:hypothetical protein
MQEAQPLPGTSARAELPEEDESKAEPEPEVRPRTGVEIVAVEARGGVNYYTVRDLRNGNMVKNVTQKSARKLWHQAISRFAKLPKDPGQLKAKWQGALGLLDTIKVGKSVRYELVQQTAGGYRYYYGVTDDGIHGAWKQLVGLDDSVS